MTWPRPVLDTYELSSERNTHLNAYVPNPVLDIYELSSERNPCCPR